MTRRRHYIWIQRTSWPFVFEARFRSQKEISIRQLTIWTRLLTLIPTTRLRLPTAPTPGLAKRNTTKQYRTLATLSASTRNLPTPTTSVASRGSAKTTKPNHATTWIKRFISTQIILTLSYIEPEYALIRSSMTVHSRIAIKHSA